ncbi:MAG: hypothetical protein WAO95_00550 [Burkholderiales bacterium]
MNELSLHPNIYATGHSKGLVSVLERVWLREQKLGQGTFYIMSGFANYNGGVRFYQTFRQHVEKGGKIVAIFSGSTGARLSSRQVVIEMLKCGAAVHVINRKRLLHAKCYGSHSPKGEMLVVTSGNFTGPGMSQNVELSLLLDHASTESLGFSWNGFIDSVLAQKWAFYEPSLAKPADPGWKLLYDEQAAGIVLDDTDEVTMILRLGHADTARINAKPRTTAGKGTQYFWLSKDCYDFFPPLTILNTRGYKATYSCIVEMNYLDISYVDKDCRITFEAENNLDFRLGTGPLRYTGIAKEGDIAAISRTGDSSYQMRIYRQRTANYGKLIPYAVHLIGHQGKKYGFLSNDEFGKLVGVRLVSRASKSRAKTTHRLD